MRDSVFGLMSELSGIEMSTSVPVALRENEWDELGEISDEAHGATDEGLFDDHDEGLFEYDLVVQMPPKERFKVVMRIRSVKKAEPPELDPSWFL